MDCPGRSSSSSLPLVGLGSAASCSSKNCQIESQTTAKTCCECENGAKHSIYLDHTSDSGDSLPGNQRIGSTKGIDLNKLDLDLCRSYELHGLESARKNNSTDSPSSSSAAVIPSLEPHWHLHDSLCTEVEMEFSGLRSATESLAPNNYNEEDVKLIRVRDHEEGQICWNHDSNRETQSNPSEAHLTSSLESTIAVLGVGVKQRDETARNFGSKEKSENTFPLQSFLRTTDMLSASESTLSPLETQEKIELDSLDNACNFPFNIPTPCAMPCTREEQIRLPLEIAEEQSTISDEDQFEDPTVPPANEAEGSSPYNCWTPESLCVPGANSSWKSWASRRKSAGRGAVSVSMSDWDVYEAGIQVKRHHAYSDSDGAFEEFVRDQEAHFTPPIVLAGDAWDPLEYPIPNSNFFQENREEDTPCLAVTQEIEPAQLTQWRIPSMHDVGVQVCSRDLQPGRKPNCLRRLLGKSSDVRLKLITAWKTTRVCPWTTKRQLLQTSPASFAEISTIQQSTSTSVPPDRSESPITMVSIQSPSCGLHTQLKKLVPRRFIQNTPRNDLPEQFINDATPCSNTYDSIFYLDRTSHTGELPQTGHSHHQDRKGVRGLKMNDMR